MQMASSASAVHRLLARGVSRAYELPEVPLGQRGKRMDTMALRIGTENARDGRTWHALEQ